MQSPFFNDPFFRRFFGEPDMPQYQEMQSLGSGVIVDSAKGYVLTNAHVVKGAEEVRVTLMDDREFKAKVVGVDDDTDIAVLKINADRLTAINLGDSDRLQVGDFVVAIGNPFGLHQTVTSGIISALGRSGIGNPDQFEDFIQTDASINPGNSGGALVDMAGRLVGVNTAILSQSGGNIGIGFAIPVNITKQVMDQIIKYGKINRGRLGVIVQNLTPDLAKALKLNLTQGVVVTKVQPGTPAAKAGLKAGDVIVGINGRKVESYRDLRNTIGCCGSAIPCRWTWSVAGAGRPFAPAWARRRRNRRRSSRISIRAWPARCLRARRRPARHRGQGRPAQQPGCHRRPAAG